MGGGCSQEITSRTRNEVSDKANETKAKQQAETSTPKRLADDLPVSDIDAEHMERKKIVAHANQRGRGRQPRSPLQQPPARSLTTVAESWSRLSASHSPPSSRDLPQHRAATTTKAKTRGTPPPSPAGVASLGTTILFTVPPSPRTPHSFAHSLSREDKSDSPLICSDTRRFHFPPSTQTSAVPAVLQSVPQAPNPLVPLQLVDEYMVVFGTHAPLSSATGVAVENHDMSVSHLTPRASGGTLLVNSSSSAGVPLVLKHQQHEEDEGDDIGYDIIQRFGSDAFEPLTALVEMTETSRSSGTMGSRSSSSSRISRVSFHTHAVVLGECHDALDVPSDGDSRFRMILRATSTPDSRSLTRDDIQRPYNKESQVVAHLPSPMLSLTHVAEADSFFEDVGVTLSASNVLVPVSPVCVQKHHVAKKRTLSPSKAQVHK